MQIRLKYAIDSEGLFCSVDKEYTNKNTCKQNINIIDITNTKPCKENTMHLCRAKKTFQVNQSVANEVNDHAEEPCEYWTDRRLDEQAEVWDRQADRQTAVHS